MKGESQVNGIKKAMICMLAVVVAVSFIVTGAEAKGKKARNVIFIVPDGMGLSYVTATRIFKNGPDGARLAFETLPVIGYQSTHSKNSTVTDSAAAASAWASGEKFNNGEISCHDDNSDGTCDSEPVPTLLDLAKAKKKSTALVATSAITHATPASFGANVHNRKCEEEIARQYLDREIDVLLGGGLEGNRGSCVIPASDDFPEGLHTEYADSGYAVVFTEEELNAALEAGAEKLLGLFTEGGGKTPEADRFEGLDYDLYPETEPTLPKMTAAALDIVEENKKGFFMVLEGSQIDWAGHANDAVYQLGEMLAFDEAVEVVLDWVHAKKKREKETLIVVVADHETGGHAIDGPYSEDGSNQLSEPGDIVDEGWTSGDHSAVDTVIWAKGPGSEAFGRALDNTDLYDLIKNAMK
jgi:alkaline phosphatase